MHALAIAMVKNESDIIEAFVRHNLAFVDLMVVIDNASSDGTRDILVALQREGLPIVVFDDPIFGYYQSEKMTHVYRKVAPVFQPDIILLLDADEFIHAPDRKSLEEAMTRVPAGSTALLSWRTHLPSPGVQVDSGRLLADPLGSMPARRRQEEPTYYKAVIRRAPSLDGLLVVDQGNHAVRIEGGPALPQVRLDGAELVHLPVRSVEQLSAKVINGWHAYLVKNRRRQQATAGFQWELLYQKFVRGDGISCDELCQSALDYAQQHRPTRNPVSDIVHDPVEGRYGSLRYLHLARTGALAKVALSAEAYLLQEPDAAKVARPAHAPQDLAPLAELIRQSGVHRISAVGEGMQWLAGLVESVPGLEVVLEEDPQLLLLPTQDLEVFARVAPHIAPHVTHSIVNWSPHRDPTAMRTALHAWREVGWEPNLLQTMGCRALSSYAAHRGSILVLQPTDPSRIDRSRAVAELLASLASAASTWPDPAPQQMRHPMQDMRV